MKQTEKNQKSRTLILQNAFKEFAQQGYVGSSLNLICARGKISKGLMYHYYTSKDDLYLACITCLFDDLANYLQDHLDLQSVTVEEYFTVRFNFFQHHIEHRKLFYDVLTYPPTHLRDQISEKRKSFDEINHQALQAVLQKERLSEHLTMETAMEQFQSFVNYFSVYVREDQTADGEQKARQLLHTMLYGMIARKE